MTHDTCCRCHVTPIPPFDPEDDFELGDGENQGDPELPVLEPVPEGRHPDPDSDHGIVCPACITTEDRQEARAGHPQRAWRVRRLTNHESRSKAVYALQIRFFGLGTATLALSRASKTPHRALRLATTVVEPGQGVDRR